MNVDEDTISTIASATFWSGADAHRKTSTEQFSIPSFPIEFDTVAAWDDAFVFAKRMKSAESGRLRSAANVPTARVILLQVTAG